MMENNNRKPVHQNEYLQTIVSLTIPFLFMFGIYVLLNGHISPGGGFSGGAILAAGIALHSIAFGREKTREFFTFKTFSTLSVISLCFYGLAKGYSFFMGANHLSTGIPLGTPGNIISSGLIFPLNLAVGIVVACTVYGIYALFDEGDI